MKADEEESQTYLETSFPVPSNDPEAVTSDKRDVLRASEDRKNLVHRISSAVVVMSRSLNNATHKQDTDQHLVFTASRRRLRAMTKGRTW
jgi:hypothetical protein